jgi:cytochrome c oxidase subunit 3
MIRQRIVGDLSHLPDHAFGPRSLMWWGILGFMLIEGTGFLLAGGAYFFLVGHVQPWPPSQTPPALTWGVVFTVLIVLSEIPNAWTNAQAHAYRDRQTRIGLVVMSLVGAVLLAIRFLGFQTLNTRWDANPYGSIIWALMILHTVHVITDLGDTLFITVVSFIWPFDGGEYAGVSDNCVYWRFVVLTWLPIAGLVYLGPRLL